MSEMNDGVLHHRGNCRVNFYSRVNPVTGYSRCTTMWRGECSSLWDAIERAKRETSPVRRGQYISAKKEADSE